MTQYPAFLKLYSYAKSAGCYTIFEGWVLSRIRLLTMKNKSL